MNSIVRDEIMNMVFRPAPASDPPIIHEAEPPQSTPKKCNLCNITHPNKKAYDAHRKYCRLKFDIIQNPKLHINDALAIKKENIGSTTTYLLETVMSMKQRIEELETIIHKQKKKVSILEWLNTHVFPTTTFQEWYYNIALNETHMFLVVESNFQTGVMSILKQLLPIDYEEKVPMRSYHENKNTIYVYVENKDTHGRYWTKMTSTQLDLVIKNITNRLIVLLFDWKQKREEQLGSQLEDFDDEHKKYTNYKSKILANEKDIQRPLYEYLKMRLSGAVEYEFTWN